MEGEAILNLLDTLKTAINEESKKPGILISILDEAQTALQQNNFSQALSHLDELEEFMDLEFCN